MISNGNLRKNLQERVTGEKFFGLIVMINLFSHHNI